MNTSKIRSTAKNLANEAVASNKRSIESVRKVSPEAADRMARTYSREGLISISIQIVIGYTLNRYLKSQNVGFFRRLVAYQAVCTTTQVFTMGIPYALGTYKDMLNVPKLIIKSSTDKSSTDQTSTSWWDEIQGLDADEIDAVARGWAEDEEMETFSEVHTRYEVLNVKDYWTYNMASGWRAKPNPHPEGTPEHDTWAKHQDETSF